MQEVEKCMFIISVFYELCQNEFVCVRLHYVCV